MLLDIYGCKDNEIENWLKWENGYELTKTGTSWLGRYELTKKWVRVDQEGYELTRVRVDLGTSWPVTFEIENWLKWENGYELTKTGTSWLGRYELTKKWVRVDQEGYELTRVRVDLGTSWPVTLNYG